MAKRKKFPKSIAVAWNTDTDPAEYLCAEETAEELAEPDGEWREVGEYQLVRVVRVRTESKVERK